MKHRVGRGQAACRVLCEKPRRPRWTPLSTCFLPETPVSYDNTLHPYSAYCCKSFAPRDSLLFLSQFLYPGLLPSRASYWWVPTGHDCPHRQGPGPAMASICHCGSPRFQRAFLFSHSSPLLSPSSPRPDCEGRVKSAIKVGQGQTGCPLIRFSGRQKGFGPSLRSFAG